MKILDDDCKATARAIRRQWRNYVRLANTAEGRRTLVQLRDTTQAGIEQDGPELAATFSGRRRLSHARELVGLLSKLLRQTQPGVLA